MESGTPDVPDRSTFCRLEREAGGTGSSRNKLGTAKPDDPRVAWRLSGLRSKPTPITKGAVLQFLHHAPTLLP
jgi:hypothetical protein